MSPFFFALSLTSVLLVPFLGFFAREELRARRKATGAARS
jgi:hypothetical protein